MTPRISTPLVPIPAPFDLEELYKNPPPTFGHEMHKLFGFDPGYVNLNHGSYGSLPLPVRVACDMWTTEAEANPDKFMKFVVLPYQARVRERVAKLIGADADECVMVANTSHGISTVLRNFSFNKGDVLIGANITYPSVLKMLKYLADTPPYPTVSILTFEFPTTREAILEAFRKHIRKVKEEYQDQDQNRKFVAVIDTIVSIPGALLPWKEMVAVCREAGVYSVLDAAHSIGQELNINLSEARPDFWVSNCHKWLYAKRGCAVLYVPRRNQHIVRSPIATPDNYRSPQDEDYTGPLEFSRLFEWTGTIDFVPQLSVDAALDFREWLGGEHKINEYTRKLAMEGGMHLARRLGTDLLDPEGNMTLNMVNVGLPLPGEIPSTDEVSTLIRDTLLLKWNTYAFCFRHNEKWWVRCSAQIFNEISDFHFIADALKDACEKVKESHARHAT
ncbi:pyridoxal phosphate-dependent transferase [Scleroderma yunnanense]